MRDGSLAVLSNLATRQESVIKGKRILITGAAGTIGSALCDRLLTLDPAVVRLLDHDEERAFYLELKHRENKRVRVLLGNIRDRDRMQRAIQDIDIVFHAAALKHVGLGEYNPFEVVRTNLVAIQSLIECAIDANVEKFIFTSSDKAVNPTNVMGGSKFIGERLITAANIYRGKKRTIFASTRFGNVLGSAGSVVPIFQKQIRAGGPVTITSREMTRFFMTKCESVDLLMSAAVASHGGEVFVPKMHSVRLMDLAKAMIELLGNGKDIGFKEIGLRPGEKMYEELISEEELPRCLETEKLLIVLSNCDENHFTAAGKDASLLAPEDYPDKARYAKAVFSSRSEVPNVYDDVVRLMRDDVLSDDTASPLQK